MHSLTPQWWFFLSLILFFLDWISGFKFTLLHTNDMHSRFDPISHTGGRCKTVGDCFGGFGRVAEVISAARNTATDPVIYLNGGDSFQGTSWFSVYRGKMVARMLNFLAPDAMALGVHELDDGTDALAEFLNTITFPMVSSNINLINEPKLAENTNLVTSLVITKGDRKIGIVGYIRPDTKERTQPSNVIFKQEVPAINKETKKLRDQGIDIIIALGHSGYEKDMEIAKRCPDVDIVVGGQSHTFLYSGKAPSKEVSEGPYPTIVVKPDGRKVPVVQAYAYTKYLGNLSLEFDSGGNLLSFKGSPILLDNRFQPRRDVQDFLQLYRQVIDDMERHVVGTTSVYLNGDRKSCGYSECNFGNFIADSFVYARVVQTMADRSSWTDASIGLINAGAIRASIDPGETGAITEADVVTVLPFSQDLYYTRISGSQLMKALEHSAQMRSKHMTSAHLQVSGLRLKFNHSLPKGERITEIRALCSECQIPHYEAVDTNGYYGVVVTSFLLNGGEGYSFVDPKRPEVENMTILDRMAVIQYLQEHKVIYPEREDRQYVQQKHIANSGYMSLEPNLILSFLYFCHRFLV
ncbi:protein 5NUC isoform X1 [Drosophila sechellia]|uniref:GM21783 n=2 Tax=Drosophila sechellia TaxID=7238 RepID=B4HMU6_DROSE|nr:protein 5NUC isoform X1 [Drosophila sechellia]EDW48296.1 GM21783 [Drosophila sechellia]